MSSTGLYSGLYSKVREYAELLDGVLIRLKDGQNRADDAASRRLAELLVAIDKTPFKDLSTQLLAVLIRDPHRDRSTGLSEVGEALLRGDVSPAIIERLEELATQLERERSSMVGFMRGRSE